MGLPNDDNIKDGGGYLILNPTDLSDPLPYGGTNLGAFSSFFWIPGQRTVKTRAKEKGRTANVIHVGGDLTAGCVLREQTDEVMSFAFPGTTVGSSSGSKVVNFPVQASGTELSSNKLLFVSQRPTEIYSLLIYAAVVEFDATSRIRFSKLKDIVTPIIITGLEDVSGRIAKWGLLEDLTL